MAKNCLFIFVAVIGFFGVLESGLRLIEYEPKIAFQSYEIPSWIANLDTKQVEIFKKEVVSRRFVNEDVYAYRFDPVLGFMLKPNINMEVKNYSDPALIDKLPKWRMFSNEQGFRASAINTSPGQTSNASNSIYIFGDSSSFGWGVEFEETYGYVLKERLNQLQKNTHRDYVLFNYSIPGFTSFHGRLLLDRWHEIKKGDLVLVSYGANDASQAQFSYKERTEKQQSLPSQAKRFLEYLYFCKVLKAFLLEWGFKKDRTTDLGKTKPFVSAEEYKENLRHIFDTIQKRGGQPIFVAVCNKSPYVDVAKQMTETMGINFFEFPGQFSPYLETVRKNLVLPNKFRLYFSVYGSMMKPDANLEFLFPDKCHPNVVGHALMSEIIFKKLGSPGEFKGNKPRQ